MEKMENANYAFLCPKFSCKTCDYNTSKKSSFTNHCKSKNHILLTEEMIGNDFSKLCPKNYACVNCNKIFKVYSGLWKHKKKCVEEIMENKDKKEKNEVNIDNFISDGKIIDKDALVIHLLKQNSELQKSLIEMSREKTVTTNNTDCYNTNTTTNNSFNLNFFLNETCKNAMNITDFVSSIKVSIDDLENTGRIGYVEGISDIIIKNLNKLEQWFRPIHCSDFKREVLYIKNNDKWEKETDEKPILTRAIKVIANENIKQINNWKDKYPGCTNAESRKNDMYLKIVGNAMNGSTKEEGEKNINKIISNVAKGVIIKK
jgi:hypothetical protein